MLFRVQHSFIQLAFGYFFHITAFLSFGAACSEAKEKNIELLRLQDQLGYVNWLFSLAKHSSNTL